MIALVGESGCGKTTIAQTILRLVDPVSGSIALDGRDITHLSQRELRPVRRTMQMIYQDPYESLDPRLRVRQAIEEPMLIHRLGGKRAERERRIIDALARVDLSPAEMYLDRYPHELSGGQRQRVAIATALVLEPRLLVADEPVSMLDVSVRAGVLRLLDGLRRSANLGIVMITHDLSTAARFADRIAVMYLGRIVEEGPALETSSATPDIHTRRRCCRSCPSVTPAIGPYRRSSAASRRTQQTSLPAAASTHGARWRKTAAERSTLNCDPRTPISTWPPACS